MAVSWLLVAIVITRESRWCFPSQQENNYYNEGDAFFSNKQTSIVDNEDESDALDRIVYCMGNPVTDGIERVGKNHKGMRLRWPQPDRVNQALQRVLAAARERWQMDTDEARLRCFTASAVREAGRNAGRGGLFGGVEASLGAGRWLLESRFGKPGRESA